MTSTSPPNSNKILPPPFTISPEKTLSRNLTKDITPFLHNLIYNSTKPLPFENHPIDIYSFPLIREHHDSYLYYIYSKQTTHETDDPTIKITFPPLSNFNTDTFTKLIHAPISSYLSKMFLKNLSTH